MHNNGDNDPHEPDLISILKNAWQSDDRFNLYILAERIIEIVKTLNTGVGHDGIHKIFLKEATYEFLTILATLLNACYSHCYIPPSMLVGDINPIIKDLSRNSTESKNCRPVMQSSFLLKIVEKHILNILEEKLYFICRQLGFNMGCFTTDACFLLKENVHFNTPHTNKIYVLFIDFSKAFDRVNHFLLGKFLCSC